MLDRVQRCQDVEPGVSVELGCEDVGLQVLIEGLAQHLLIEMNAVKPRPCGGRPARDQGRYLLRELEELRQFRIQQLCWAHTGDRERPG